MMNWTLAFKTNLPIPFEWKLAGFNIIDSEDTFVSRVVDLLCEEETKKVRYLLGEIGGLLRISGKAVLVPVSIITPGGSGQVVAATTLEMIMSSPIMENPENPTREEEEAIFLHYEAKPYWKQSTIETSPKEREEETDNSDSINLEGMENNNEEN